MAPLHHHFELIGWSEPKVITRFLIVAIIFALFSLTTLKLQMTRIDGLLRDGPARDWSSGRRASGVAAARAAACAAARA